MSASRCYVFEVFLSKRIWTTPQNVEVRIAEIPRYEQFAAELLEKHEKGASAEVLARMFRMSCVIVKESITFARTDQRPVGKKRTPRTGRGGKEQKYKDISDQVATMRDEQNMPFKHIAKILAVADGTVRAAYDHAHPEHVQLAACNGKVPKRGSYSHLGGGKYREIRRLLRQGLSQAAVARIVECGQSTVSREWRRMKSTEQ